MSEDLFLEGKKFISVRRASSITGYTQDYLGQLCRGEKVSAKMIGRTWYLDSEALLNHKKDLKSRKKNLPIEAQKFEAKARVESGYISPFKFEKDSSPLLPSLPLKVKTSTPVRANHSRTLVVLSVGILLLSGVSWLNYISPRTTEIVSAAISQGLRQNLASVNLLSASGVNPAAPSTNSKVGVVAFPDPDLHDEAVGAVQSAFSDEVSTHFDPSGTSGVITPVFRSGTAEDNYAFVMVPIKQSK